jgi:HlyD family secretion protein
MVKKIIFGGILLVVVAAVVMFFAKDGSAKKEDDLKTVAVTRGTIVDKALAVGKIEPKKEIEVKSKISGLIKKRYKEIGDQVKVGEPLFDIAPDPTPLEFAESKRQVELSQVEFDNRKREYDRSLQLKDKQLISHQEYDLERAKFDEAKLRLDLAMEKLALIETGKTSVADRKIENVIRSTVNGTILSVDLEEGDPVVPLTSYQAGTTLMTIAYMEDLVFKGNVDEIDVGKLAIGMPVEIEIGAIPNQKIEGKLVKISPKAHKEEGSTLFEVEIAITNLHDKFLRAGYSANADVIITKKDSILLVPERLVKFADSVATVEVRDSVGTIAGKTIKTGLSDGINLEVTEGLSEGDQVVERPPKEITAD